MLTHSTSNDIFDEVKKEMEYVYLHDKRPWMIGFSGGKDSTLLCSLVFEMISSIPKEKICKKVYIVTSDTMVENPIIAKYMHEMSKRINSAGKDLIIESKILYPEIENTFWCKVIGLGYPTPEAPGFRWCTERLKIKPMNKFTNETIKNNGEIIILLGVRKAESTYRERNIRNREIEGKLLIPHNYIENAYVYNPLSDIPNEIVWEYLLKNEAQSPWGTNNKYLYSLYQGEDLREEESVIGEIDKEKISVTGNSRLGCWICTMVKEDKSLKNFIENGERWLEPLRDFRNWLIEIRKNPKMRENKRRNGAVYEMSDGSLGKGPFTMDARRQILHKLLNLEKKTGLELIKKEELKVIDKHWENEGDLSRRMLVDTYYEVKGERLYWDEYKVPVYPKDVVEEIVVLCEEYNVEYDMISKLIIEIENNKNYTRSAKVRKAFDKVVNQGWLHYAAIKEGLLRNEN